MASKKRTKVKTAVQRLLKRGKKPMTLLMPAEKRGRGRPPTERRKPDREWFLDEMEKAGLSQNKIARLLGKQGSIITHLLWGNREIKIDEAIMFANVLKKPIDLVLRKAGYPELHQLTIRIVGKVTGDATVSMVTSRRGPFPAAGYPENAVAYVVETEGTPLAAYHGAVVVAADPSEVAVDSKGALPFDAFGRLCIVEAEDHKMPLLGTLGKAPARGSVTFTLFGLNETIALAKPLRAMLVYGIVFA